ncbi:hypothetical protein [Nannocystis pusilla]|uniref:hypothetical protein n=1 Tax=Nannocystis pusilla TaxID=889268 RepID=UPI003BF439E7
MVDGVVGGDGFVVLAGVATLEPMEQTCRSGGSTPAALLAPISAPAKFNARLLTPRSRMRRSRSGPIPEGRVVPPGRPRARPAISSDRDPTPRRPSSQ